jgi:hypothetical protein
MIKDVIMREIRSQGAGGLRSRRTVRVGSETESGGSCLARLPLRPFCGLCCDETRLQQFRVVRQKLLDRLLDQNLHRYPAQDGGELELSVFGLGNARAELGLGLGDDRFTAWVGAST